MPKRVLALAAFPLLIACPADDGTDPDDTGEPTLPDCESREDLTNDMFVGGAVFDAGTCWMVNENLNVNDGTVEIQEGVSIWFATDIRVSIDSGGRLMMAGTATNPIELSTDDPLVTWQGVKLENSQGSDNDWQHVVIANAGSNEWTGADYSGGAVYLEGETTLSMDNVTIQNSQDHGIVAFDDVSFTFSNGTFEGNETPAYVHPEVASAIGGETVFTDNENSFVKVVFGNNDAVVGTHTWAALDVPWRVQNRFFVEGDLTIEAGAVIEVEQAASLNVRSGASLTAEGTEEAPIVFQGASNSRGFWQGISIEAGGTDEPLTYGATFDHVTIADAGGQAWSGACESQAALYLEYTSAALVTNSTFSNSGRYGLWASDEARIDGFADNVFTGNVRPMYLHPDRVGELSGTSSFDNNDEQRIHVVFGNNDAVTKEATWPAQEVPYEIVKRFFVEEALTIEAGTVIEAAQDVQINVEDTGSISAIGTADSPVIFQGVEAIDEGYWAGIRFESNTAANVLENVELLHAGSDLWTGNAESAAALYVDDSALVTLVDTEIGPGGGYGIFLLDDSSTVSCTNVTFTSLAWGNVYDDDSDSVLSGCP